MSRSASDSSDSSKCLADTERQVRICSALYQPVPQAACCDLSRGQDGHLPKFRRVDARSILANGFSIRESALESDILDPQELSTLVSFHAGKSAYHKVMNKASSSTYNVDTYARRFTRFHERLNISESGRSPGLRSVEAKQRNKHIKKDQGGLRLNTRKVRGYMPLLNYLASRSGFHTLLST